MDKKLLIDDYLEGKRPIEQEKWELPTEDELDRDEALYDALMAEKKATPLQNFLRGRRLWAAAAAVAVAVALFTWKSHTPEQLPPTPEIVEAHVVDTVEPKLPENEAQHYDQNGSPLSPKRLTIMTKKVNHYSGQATPRLKAPRPAAAEAPVKEDTIVLSNAADSLYYYLTQLENQMGDCRDSTCLAELTGLMRADERIKDLVNKIIHKQVETAYKEEYLVDTTTRYIPL